MADRIQIRRDTAANWASVNPVLAQGEMGLETDTERMKLGDGTTVYTALNYFVTSQTNVGINGGTIDGTVIGGVTPAAGSFTTLGTTGAATFSGNVGIGIAPDANGVIKLDAGAGSNTNIYFSQAGVGKFFVGHVTSSDAFRIYDVTAAAERLTISSTGAATFSGGITATGIDVTGTVTADNITASSVGGTVRVRDTSITDTTQDTLVMYAPALNTFALGVSSLTGSKKGITLTGGNDVSFYNTAGTSQSLFWDASEESLGIGTSSPSSKLDIQQATAGNIVSAEFDNTDYTATNRNAIKIRQQNSASSSFSTFLGNDGATGNVFLSNDSITANHLVINSSGNVGIGNSNPSNYTAVGASRLVVGTNVGSNGITIVGATTGYSSLAFADSAGSGGNDDYSGLIQYSHITNGMNFFTNSTQKMTLDASGNLGVGVTPLSDLHILSNTVDSTNGIRLEYNTGTAYYSRIKQHGNDMHIMADTGNTGGAMRFFVGTDDYTTGSDMVLDASGNLLVGTTSSGYLTADSGVQLYGYGGARFGADGTSARNLISFVNGTDGTPAEVGAVQTNGSSTSYLTSSDQRLKENIADADDAGSKIDAIQVRKFDWKVDGSHQDYGMVAQELQLVAPEAVSAPEDPEEMMGVDYSKLVPMMLKEIQSLRARLAILEGA